MKPIKTKSIKPKSIKTRKIKPKPIKPKPIKPKKIKPKPIKPKSIKPKPIKPRKMKPTKQTKTKRQKRKREKQTIRKLKPSNNFIACGSYGCIIDKPKDESNQLYTIVGTDKVVAKVFIYVNIDNNPPNYNDVYERQYAKNYANKHLHEELAQNEKMRAIDPDNTFTLKYKKLPNNTIPFFNNAEDIITAYIQKIKDINEDYIPKNYPSTIPAYLLEYGGKDLYYLTFTMDVSLPFPLLDFYRLFYNLFLGIKKMNLTNNFAHLDITLANILYHESKRCFVLIDFGISRSYNDIKHINDIGCLPCSPPDLLTDIEYTKYEERILIQYKYLGLITDKFLDKTKNNYTGTLGKHIKNYLLWGNGNIDKTFNKGEIDLYMFGTAIFFFIYHIYPNKLPSIAYGLFNAMLVNRDWEETERQFELIVS